MNTVLVTDTQTPLGFQLAKLFLNRGMNVIAAPSEQEPAKTYDNFKKKPFLVIPWNRPSPISAKNVIMRSIHKYNGLDAAFILKPAVLKQATLQDVKSVEMEQAIDVWIKGSLFLARECYSYFASKKKGALTFISLSPQSASGPALFDDLCREAMLSILKSLSAEARPYNLKINAMLSRTDDEKGYADFIIRTYLEKCYKSLGKLFYYQWR